MKNPEILFLGSGDAFGSGGRLQSCILVKHGQSQFLIDCGTSCLIGMERFGINPNEIATIMVSHLHGDHYGGIPFLINGAQLIHKRTAPLLILGPPGIRECLPAATEILFPGSFRVQRKYSIEIKEFEAGVPMQIDGVTITPLLNHHPQIDSSFAMRIEVNGSTIAYSSDSEWLASLADIARNADIFIAEAYCYEKQVKGHMDFLTLWKQFAATGARRLILTHMSKDMLSRLNGLPCEHATDGLCLRI